jgi:hypothetical protein
MVNCCEADTGLKGRPETGETELKGDSMGRPDSELGHMTEALIPVSGFPLI